MFAGRAATPALARLAPDHPRAAARRQASSRARLAESLRRRTGARPHPDARVATRRMTLAAALASAPVDLRVCVDRVRGQVHRPQPPALPARHRRRGRDIRDRARAFREGPNAPVLPPKLRTRARPSRLARSPRGRSTARSQRTTPPSSSISTRKMAAASHGGRVERHRHPPRMGTPGPALSPTASPPPARRYHKSNNAGASYDMATASSTARLTMDYGLH